jgi:rhodanese-related sulfurtransferase
VLLISAAGCLWWQADVEVWDIRTAEQRAGHSINELGPKAVKGSVCVPLDDMVGGTSPLPAADKPVVLVCSRGPKSLVAMDYLQAEGCSRVVCVEGGISAWETAALPTEGAAD